MNRRSEKREFEIRENEEARVMMLANQRGLAQHNYCKPAAFEEKGSDAETQGENTEGSK